MARTLIDEVAVAGSFDPAAIFRGLQTGNEAIERFRTQSRPPVRIAIEPDFGAFESDLARLGSGSPVGTDALAQQVSEQFAQIGGELAALNATLTQSLGGVTGFFQGLAEGAVSAIGEVGFQTDLAAAETDELATKSLLAAEALREQGVAEEDLNATLARSGLLSQEAITARLAEAAASRQAAADVQLLADRLRQVPEFAGESARATRFMLDAFNDSGRAAFRVSEGTADMARGVENVRRQQEGLPLLFRRTGDEAERGFGRGTVGGARLLNTLSGITVGAAGASGRIGTLASNLLVLASTAAAGGLVAAGAIATVTGLILLYENLTKGIRAARAEQERLLQRGEDRLRQQDLAPEQNFGVPGELREEAATARAKVLRLVQEQRRVEGEINQEGLDNLNILVRQNELEEIRGKLAGALSKAERLTALETEARLEAESEGIQRLIQLQREATQTQTAFAGSFAAALEAGLAIPDAARQTVAHLEQQRALANDITASNDQRVAALNAVNALELAQLAPLRRQLELLRQTTQADFERAQRLSATPLDTSRPIPLTFDTGIEDLRELGRAVDDQVEQLDVLRLRYGTTSAAAQQLTGQADQFRALGRQIDEAIEAADDAPVRLLSGAVGELAQRLELIRGGSFGNLVAETPAVAAATRDLVRVYTLLTLEIERQGGPLRANVESLQAAAQAQDALGGSTTALTQGLGLAAEQLAQAEGRLRDFRAEVDDAFQPAQLEIQVEIEAARRTVARLFDEIQQRQRDLTAQRLELLPAPAVTGISTAFEQAVGSSQDLNESLSDTARNSNAFFREAEIRAERLQRALRDDRTAAERLGDTFFDIADGIGLIGDAFIRAGAETGLFTQDTIRALQDVQAVAEDAAVTVASIASGNIAGAILGGLNLIGSIGGALGLGQSPEEAAREQAERELRVAIERLTNEVGNVDFDISGNTFAGLQRAFGIINDPRRFQLEDNTKLGLRVERLLEGFGLTIDDVKAAASEMGLEFENTAAFYEAFNDALKQIELTTFNETFKGQLEKLFAGFDILDITDPRKQFEELARLASSPEFGAPAIADAFRRFNVNLEDGLDDAELERAREALRDVFRRFQELTPEQLGELSPKELLEILARGTGLATDALDELTESVDGASRRLGDLDIPRGFRRAAIAFETGEPGPDRGREFGDAFPFDGRTLGGDGASLPLLQDILGELERQDFAPLTRVLEDQDETLSELVTELRARRGSPALPGISADPNAAQARVIQVSGGLHVHVSVSGGTVTAAMQADITNAVVAGLRELGMNQSGDTLQIPVF